MSRLLGVVIKQTNLGRRRADVGDFHIDSFPDDIIGDVGLQVGGSGEFDSFSPRKVGEKLADRLSHEASGKGMSFALTGGRTRQSRRFFCRDLDQVAILQARLKRRRKSSGRLVGDHKVPMLSL